MERVELTSQQERFIQQSVESGLFESRADLISCALGFLQDLSRADLLKLAELRAKIRESVDALGQADYSEYGEDTLHELFDSIDARLGVSSADK